MVQAGTRHDFVKTKEYRGPSVPSPLTNNPRAGQWTNAMSHNMIADYKRFLMTDGEGIRCSLYVSGCPFHCEGCYNSSIWDFQAGHEYNEKLEAQIMDDLAQSFVQGITFLGGEPLLNTGVLLPLARKIRERFGHTKDIWCWTGYTWEELMREGEPRQARPAARDRHPRRRPLHQNAARFAAAVPRLVEPAHHRRARIT